MAFWADEVSHLHHEIKEVNIWLVFRHLLTLKKLISRNKD
jgi:hypothetical protein